jgi:hypothetical protein
MTVLDLAWRCCRKQARPHAADPALRSVPGRSDSAGDGHAFVAACYKCGATAIRAQIPIIDSLTGPDDVGHIRQFAEAASQCRSVDSCM